MALGQDNNEMTWHLKRNNCLNAPLKQRSPPKRHECFWDTCAKPLAGPGGDKNDTETVRGMDADRARYVGEIRHASPRAG